LSNASGTTGSGLIWACWQQLAAWQQQQQQQKQQQVCSKLSDSCPAQLVVFCGKQAVARQAECCAAQCKAAAAAAAAGMLE
jgi:hypothetical protein